MSVIGRRTRVVDGATRALSAMAAWSLVGALPLVVLALALRGGAQLGAQLGQLALALAVSALLAGLALAIAAPLGLGAAIWLEDYLRAPRVRALVELNLAALEAAPTLSFGLLALVLLRSGGLIACALTIAAAMLAGIISSCRVAIVEVSASEREAGLALGGTRGRILIHVVLPVAGRAIWAAMMRAFARGLGLTAPLVVLLGLLGSPAESGAPLSLAIFEALADGSSLEIAASAALVLVLAGLALDGAASWLRPPASAGGGR